MIKKIKNYFIKSFLHLRGYTFIELAVVIFIIGLMTGTVGIVVDDLNSDVRLSNAAARALSDIKELKEMAMNQGSDVRISVNPGANSYTLTVDGVVKETVEFNTGDYSGVKITSSEFGGDLRFNATGMPNENGAGFTDDRDLMNINNGEAIIKVWGRSGLVSVDMPDWPGGGCGIGC